MKDSGVEWIGEIPEDWDISKVRRGFRVSKTIAGDKANELPRLSLSNAGVLERPKYDGFGESPADYATYQIIPGGQFVFNFMGLEQDSLYRRVGISPMTGLVSAGYMEADYISTQINPEYAYYFFRFMENGLLFKQYGSGIRSNLNKQQFHNMPFLFPPLDEQARISAVIKHKVEAIDTIISEIQQSIDELKKYKQVLITETVTKGLDKNTEMINVDSDYTNVSPSTWTKVKLKYLCSMQSGKNLTSEEINTDDIYPVYGANGIRGYYYKYNFSGEFLTVGRQGALSGNVHYVQGKVWATDHALVTNATNKVLVKFLYYLINAMNLNQYAYNAAQPGIAASFILNLSAYIPEAKVLQRRITDFLDEKSKNVENLIYKKELLLNQLYALKQSTIYEYVTGKKEA